MPNAFNNVTMNNLQGGIRTLFYRRQKVGKLKLTNEEYLQTFVPREVRDVFRDAAPYVAQDTRRHRFDLVLPPATIIKAALDMHTPGLVARSFTIQPDAPKEVTEKIYNWAERGGDISREFGRVLKVLDIFNTTMSRVAIRYYWPTILALGSESHNTKELVEELQEMRQPARLKPLPPGLQIACKLTAETIASARLLPADIEEDEGGEVVIDIITGQTYSETFATFYGMG